MWKALLRFLRSVLQSGVKEDAMYDEEALAVELKRDEGFRAHAYQDPEGYWTIGYGRLVDERLGGGVTEEEADYLLRNDIQRVAVGALDAIYPDWRHHLDAVRQRVLLNMAFNLGERRLRLFERMWVAVEREDWDTAAAEMRNSLWFDQVGIRARRLASAMRTGDPRYLSGERAPEET